MARLLGNSDNGHSCRHIVTIILFQDAMNHPELLASTPPFPSTEAVLAQLRSMPGARLLRLLLALLQRAWPPLAVRLACGVFLTPLPAKFLRRRASMDASWHAKRWPFEGGDVMLYHHDSNAEGPLVLLVHGWGGNAGQMRPLAEALSAQGLRPVIIDLPAHGRSTGWQSSLPQFARAIEYIGAQLAHEGTAVQAIVAHSLGASASALAAARGLPVERLVLLAPAASPPAYTRLFAQVFGLTEHTRAAMQVRIEAREAMLMPQFEPRSLGARLDVPVLIAHDRSDRVNAFSDGLAYVQALPRAELFATEGLGHNRILKDPHVMDYVADFVAQNVERAK